MKRIILKKLRIENFKDCRERTIDFGSVTNIYGANAAGKTTIFDAFMWLMFGKDSSGTEKFNVRPLDSAGNTIDNVEILVEAVLDVDGKEETLQKVQKQNWVKKHGSDVTKLQGNTNTYEINSFPAGEKEFKEHIAGIISEDLFKLLTDPRAFANLPWKKQREILMQFISEVTDADVLAIDTVKYEPLEDDVLAAPVEKCIEKAKKAMLKLKERQKELPARIDEASKSLVEIPELSNLELQRNALNEQLTEVHKQRDDSSQSYKVVEDIQAEIMAVQFEIGGLQQEASSKLDKQRREARRICDELDTKVFDLFDVRRKKEVELSRQQKYADERELERGHLGVKWKELKSLSMDEADMVCKFCGQTLPADRIEQIRTDFEKNKKAQIDKVLEEGMNAKQDVEAALANIQKLEGEIVSLRQQWGDATGQKNKAYEALNAIPASVDISENQEYQALQLKLSNLQNKLGSMDDGKSFKQQLDIKESGIREELDAVNKQFAVVEANERIQERIEELKAEQKDIAQKVADQEQKIFLLEEFSRAKMEALSRGINGQFKMVNFKLFDIQINGGMKDTCEMTVDGVPYGSLNSAAKMQAGLDVICSLSRLYNASVPVWLDNRESVSEIPEIDCQIINLFVSATDKVLRVEVQE